MDTLLFYVSAYYLFILTFAKPILFFVEQTLNIITRIFVNCFSRVLIESDKDHKFIHIF